MCVVAKSGQIQSANDCFHALRGSSDGSHEAGFQVDACFSWKRRLPESPRQSVRCDLITRAGGRVPVTVEIMDLPEHQEEIWLIVPALGVPAGSESRPGASADAVCALLRENVAPRFATLARNLRRASQSGQEDSTGAAELLRSSLLLVEQCSIEVRRMAKLLRANIGTVNSGSEKRNCA
jgi:hypothetical protein